MKTSLGIWALGPMITRFVPVGLPARARERADRRQGAARGRRARRPDGRLRVSLPGRAATPTTSTRCATRSTGTGSPACAPASTPTRASAGRAHLGRRGDAGRGATPDPGDRRARRLARREHDLLARDRGLQLPLPDAVRPVVGVVPRGDGRGGGDLREARGQALPRAQELRARDEDLHAQHRDDDARDPHAARTGAHERPGQHGLAAPDHERRDARRIRGLPRRAGAARTSARELGLGDIRRRQYGRRDRVHGDDSSSRSSCGGPTTARTESGSASTSTPIRRMPSRP